MKNGKYRVTDHSNNVFEIKVANVSRMDDEDYLTDGEGAAYRLGNFKFISSKEGTWRVKSTRVEDLEEITGVDLQDFIRIYMATHPSMAVDEMFNNAELEKYKKSFVDLGNQNQLLEAEVSELKAQIVKLTQTTKEVKKDEGSKRVSSGTKEK